MTSAVEELYVIRSLARQPSARGNADTQRETFLPE
jgi:hypothetical protein